jgi:hypothetical protein
MCTQGGSLPTRSRFGQIPYYNEHGMWSEYMSRSLTYSFAGCGRDVAWLGQIPTFALRGRDLGSISPVPGWDQRPASVRMTCHLSISPNSSFSGLILISPSSFSFVRMFLIVLAASPVS